MPRRKQFGKRKCHRNQFMKIEDIKECADTEVLKVSASKSKLTNDDSFSAQNVSENNKLFCNEEAVNIIFDLKILKTLLNAVSQCKYCKSDNCFDVIEEVNSRKGLASSLLFICTNCGNSCSSMTSTISKTGYEINNRLVYGMRCIGKGKNAARTLCAVMNLPPPPSKFERYNANLSQALSSVCVNSMSNAVEGAVSRNNNSRDITVALDGTWQKRGHTSLNGVITATSLDTGKVIDFECLSKFCFVCKNQSSDCENCQKNYEGYSGGMESEGASRMFHRSISTRKVRYAKYLGDGDSKGFLKISESNVYKELTVEKLECIGHVQKRMGARLRNLRTKMKSTKLSDGKKISGRGRLTDAQIQLIQKYYGLAIRRNTSKSVDEMAKSIWAIYFHKLSTDAKPQHGLCPMGSDSWCGYNKSLETGEKYRHQHSLPEPVLLAVKKVFRELADKKLLMKCIHGQTQNPNESFNNCVWERIPKNTFVGMESLRTGVMDAVICFNDGVFRRTEVLKNMGIAPGKNTCAALRKTDDTRIREAEYMFQKARKEARTIKRQLKRVSELTEIARQDEYGPGKF